MGIKYGNIFHLLIACVLAINLRLVWVLRSQSIDIGKAAGSDVWRS